MHNEIKVRKEYHIKDTENLKPNRKEQVLLLFAINKLTSLHGNELVEHLLNVTIPMVGQHGESQYNVRAHLRWKKRKILTQLLKNYLELKEC